MTIILKSVNVNGEIIDAIGKINMELTYVNELSYPINAIYYFALDSEAITAINYLKMIIDNKILNGLVKEKEQSKKDYNDAVISGKKTSLLEKMNENEYKLSIGNIEPNQTVVIKYGYITKLVCNEKDEIKFVLPTNIGEKYNKNYNNYDKRILYSSNVDFVFNLELNWKSNNEIKEIYSLTNKIEVEENSSNEKKIKSSTVPKNGDFNLFVNIESNPSVYYYSEEENKNYVMITKKICDESKRIRNLNYYYMIDTSGSMDGKKLNDAKDALINLINILPDGSYFNIIEFNSNYKAIWKKNIEYNEKNKKIALNIIKKYVASGGTELYNCLNDTINNNINEYTIDNRTDVLCEYDKVYVLLTDGQTSDYERILKMLYLTKNVRIMTIGIGDDFDRKLVKNIANMTNGCYQYVIDTKTLNNVILEIMNNIQKQYYKSVYIKGNEESTLIKCVYPNKYYTFILKLNDEELNKYKIDEFVIEGTNAITNELKKWRLHFEENEKEIVKLFYGFLKINKISEKLKYELIDDVNEKNMLKYEIIKLSVENNIMTEYTSFIIVDETKTVDEESNDVVIPNYSRGGEIELQSTGIILHNQCKRIDKSNEIDWAGSDNENEGMEGLVLNGGLCGMKLSNPSSVSYGGSKGVSNASYGRSKGVSYGKNEIAKGSLPIKSPNIIQQGLNYFSNMLNRRPNIEIKESEAELKMNLKEINKLQNSDGSFKYDCISYLLINYKFETDFSNDAKKCDLSNELYFMFVILKELDSDKKEKLLRWLLLSYDNNFIEEKSKLVHKTYYDYLNNL